MKLNEQYKEIPVYQPGKSIREVQEELGLAEVIKLASNENPYGSSKKVLERLRKEAEFVSVYPDGSAKQLKEKLAAFYGIDESQLILGNGSDEIIQYLSRIYLNPETEVIMAVPTFPMYKTNALMEKAKVIEIPLLSGKHDLHAMLQAVTDSTAMIWICNPNNPTGTIISEADLIYFLDSVPDQVLVVVDEAYYEYVSNDLYPNTIQLLNRYPNLMILRTFSKIYGLASLRIGYGIGNKQIIEDLHRVKEPFNANHLAQISADEALNDQEFVKQCKEQNQQSKLLFMKGLDELGYSYYPTEANFILVLHQMDDNQVFQRFQENGIIVRAGNKLGYPGSVRVTIGTAEQMKKVLDILKELR